MVTGSADATRRDPAAMFNENLALVARAVRHVAQRHFLGRQDLEDFEAEVHLKLVDDDYAVLRRFEGRSRLSTYLITVIQRAFLDFQIKRWGKWRPSAAARHLGPLAVALERLVSHEERTFEEACAILDAAPDGPVDRERLWEILARLPVRPRRRSVGPDRLAAIPARYDPDAGMEAAERVETARRAEKSLTEALERLAPDDRLVVKLAYADGMTISSIARTLGRNQRRLYRTLERCLGAIRAHMEACGVAGPSVRGLLGHPAVRIEVPGLRGDDAETPAPGPSHSAGEGSPGAGVSRGRP